MNIIEHIAKYRNDETFRPSGGEPEPTDEMPGPSKVEVMRKRAIAGQELWSKDDPTGYGFGTVGLEELLLKEGDIRELS